MPGERMSHRGDQHLLDRLAPPGVAYQDRDIRVEVQRIADIRLAVSRGAVEVVGGDHEWRVPNFEIVDRGEAVGEPPGIDEHDRSECTEGEFIPHEPEPFLSWGAEQIEHHTAWERDPAEIHRNRGSPLVRHSRRVIDPDTNLAEVLLGAQRPDLADGPDKSGLADAEPARDQQLGDDRHRRQSSAWLRALEDHQARSSAQLPPTSRGEPTPPQG